MPSTQTSAANLGMRELAPRSCPFVGAPQSLIEAERRADSQGQYIGGKLNPEHRVHQTPCRQQENDESPKG
ncbi:hypothetical protein [Cryobacterium sp. CG_9.6]|uniref:hypothetical protein n=1 Tax=Cryobacterium sp. CG_9.6 TaxID=2760710 RepID=UPI002472F19F|nr:hypothetical protein [Cryobacterium sp. CG_9.6]MDH6237812.1 hypothetical protein [Cryobacterium sp. CG_9.6]